MVLVLTLDLHPVHKPYHYILSVDTKLSFRTDKTEPERIDRQGNLFGNRHSTIMVFLSTSHMQSHACADSLCLSLNHPELSRIPHPHVI